MDGTRWSALGEGAYNDVYDIAVSGNDLYVVGKFVGAGGQSAKRVAKWMAAVGPRWGRGSMNR